MGRRWETCTLRVLWSVSILSCGVESAKIKISPAQGPSITLRTNHLQSKGTHNSYHVEPWPALMPAWRYTHLALRIQLGEQGVRQVELDLHYNEARHNFKVMHIRQVDADSTCRTFHDCLVEIKEWSDENPHHHLLFVMLEPKGSLEESYAATYFHDLEREILGVWPTNRIVTPDTLRGDHPNLPAAIFDRGWPTLDESSGKVAFVLLDWAEFRQAYTYGESNLDGRLIFAAADVDSPYAAVIALDEPLLQFNAIRQAVSAGYIVRTRADSDNVEAYAGDRRRLLAALTSGAHIVSTDYPALVDGVGYWVDIPDGSPARCNPITAPTPCDAHEVLQSGGRRSAAKE